MRLTIIAFLLLLSLNTKLSHSINEPGLAIILHEEGYESSESEKTVQQYIDNETTENDLNAETDDEIEQKTISNKRSKSHKKKKRWCPKKQQPKKNTLIKDQHILRKVIIDSNRTSRRRTYSK